MWSSSRTCFYWHGEQKIPLWKTIRAFAVGSSACHGFAYGNYFGKKFQSPEYYADLMQGKFEVEMNKHMERGIEDEPKIYFSHGEILKHLCEESEEKPLLTTVGIAIFKENPIYRASNDSLVYDPREKDPYGCGEYKCAQSMYPQFRPFKGGESISLELFESEVTVTLEENPSVSCYSRSPLSAYNPTKIYDSHYAQMQFQMAVTGRSWCDYVVGCFQEKIVHFQRVRFNEKYWRKLDRQLQRNLRSLRKTICEKIYLPPITDEGEIPPEELFPVDEIWKKIVPNS